MKPSKNLLSFKVLIILLSFNLKSETNLTTPDKFFWSKDSELELENLNQMCALFNKSLKLKIENIAFKTALDNIKSKIKSIKTDFKQKNKLQKNLEVIVNNISKFSQAAPKSNERLQALIEILNQIEVKDIKN